MSILKKQLFTIFVLGLLLLSPLATAWFFGFWVPNEPPFDQYPIRGVDISHHQGEIDWVELRTAGISFAYIKATEGGNFKDHLFGQNWRSAKNAGIVPGGYHVFTRCRSGLEQATNFIDTVPSEQETLPPTVDITSSDTCSGQFEMAVLVREFSEFLKEMERHYARTVIIYTARTSTFSDEVAQYIKKRAWVRGRFTRPSGSNWVFWQYTTRGRNPGVKTYVDLSVFNGGEEQFREIIEQRTRAN